MLPSRLFRNVGIPASLLRQTQPSVTFRFTPRLIAAAAAHARRPQSSLASPTSSESPAAPPEARLRMTFTCNAHTSESDPAQLCGHRSTHEFSKRSYTSGVVLVECPGCKNRHLIADHLGWFQDGTQNGKYKTIEEMVAARGEKVRRGKVQEGAETIEFFE
ncbi:zf-DNL-domain-containing protein [Flagelloscypha sp. PMI_526]|nr:zf-DNL-domain-containing protein [Flagelloscypha sp. PMI_526]